MSNSNPQNESYWTSATPLSIFCHLPVLAEDRSARSDLLKTIRFYSDKPAMLSKSLGMPTLTKDTLAFSDVLGLPTGVDQSGTLAKILKNITEIGR